MSSNVAPGQPVPLFVNDFKLRMTNSGKIYVYKVEFGPEVDVADPKQCSKAFRRMKNDLSRIFQLYGTNDSYLFSTTLVQ